jgi:GMP synthase-like glutamine amidotransferase
MAIKMKPVRVFSHVACESPGYLATLLDRLGLPFEVLCLDEQHIPGIEPGDASALVFMGGPGNVSQPTNWMRAELELIRRADRIAVPMLGICLGAQLICEALGGTVRPGTNLEVGWHQVYTRDAARGYPGFDRMASEFEIFHWHAHVCDPPATARILASSACTDCQAFAQGPHLALQFHLEMSAQNIRQLIQQYPQDLEAESNCVQDAAQISRDLERKTQQAFAIADQLLSPWFEQLKPAHEVPTV